MDEELLKLFSRLKQDPDGQEFIKYLGILSKDNYEQFKKSASDMNDIHKGMAIAYDCLLRCFETCDDELRKKAAKQEVADAHY